MVQHEFRGTEKSLLNYLALVSAPLAVWRTLIANKNTDIAYKNT